jgi:hypothetical protein
MHVQPSPWRFRTGEPSAPICDQLSKTKAGVKNASRTVNGDEADEQHKQPRAPTVTGVGGAAYRCEFLRDLFPRCSAIRHFRGRATDNENE